METQSDERVESQSKDRKTRETRSQDQRENIGARDVKIRGMRRLGDLYEVDYYYYNIGHSTRRQR